MFYDRFVELCKQKGVTASRGAIEAGISKSLVTKWKTSKVDIPSPDVLSKLSKYFNLPISELLGEENEKAPAETSERSVSDEDIMFALFGGKDDITDEMFEEVKSFADFVYNREKSKKDK
ncbi:MAG: helix-turn-helix domain-containing protein [Firmicutes bacterium]|nr:helix-turn-helix domain-containing protein [Bacillota bacterium]